MRASILHALWFALTLLVVDTALAQGKYQNKVRFDRAVEALRVEIEKIPVFEEKLTGEYTIIGMVRSQDALTKKHDAMMLNLKAQAYKFKADAVMEVKCRNLWRWVLQECEGFAVRYYK